MQKLNIGFMASHGGSNMQSIIEAIKDGRLNATACCVISNNSQSMALRRAGNEGIPAYHISSVKYQTEEELAKAIIETFDKYKVNVIVLAGYMKKLPDQVIDHYKGRVLNIHPALLPKYGGPGMFGMNVHKAVIDAGEKESGCTIHLVNSKYDEGRILNNKKVEVLPEDTPETLAARVLEKEHELYAETLQLLAEGKIKL